MFMHRYLYTYNDVSLPGCSVPWFSMTRNTMHIHRPVVCGYLRDVPGESRCEIDDKVGCLSCIVLATSSK